MNNVIKRVNHGMTKLYVQIKGRVQNQKGVSTIEWVGLAAVILAMMFAVNTAMKGNGGGIADAILNKLSELIKKVGESEG